MVAIFMDDDNGYLRWIATNPGGSVLNCDRKPHARYLKLHRAICRTVTGTPANGERWTALYAKLCSPSVQALQTLANEWVGGQLSSCGLCNP